MPRSVRSVQVIVQATTALCVLATVLVGAANGAEAAGATLGENLLGFVLFILTFQYPRADNGLRVTSIVLASLQIAVAIGGTSRGVHGGLLPLAGAVLVVVLLSRRSASDWFKRPRPMAGAYGQGTANW